jgi:hypothetical protein
MFYKPHNFGTLSFFQREASNAVKKTGVSPDCVGANVAAQIAFSMSFGAPDARRRRGETS